MKNKLANDYSRFHQEIFVDRVYEFGIPNKKDMIVVDVGAHMGIFSDYIWDRAKTIYQIEPFSSNIKYLSTRRNTKTILCPYGLAKETGNRDLRISSSNGSGSIFYTNGYIAKKVRVLSLPDFIKENNIYHIDLMKLDTEGAENEIFQEKFSDSIEKIDAIVGEFHSGVNIKDILGKFGFKVEINHNYFSARR